MRIILEQLLWLLEDLWLILEHFTAILEQMTLILENRHISAHKLKIPIKKSASVIRKLIFS